MGRILSVLTDISEGTVESLTVNNDLTVTGDATAANLVAITDVTADTFTATAPATITGELPNDATGDILVLLLDALNTLGLIDDDTTQAA